MWPRTRLPSEIPVQSHNPNMTTHLRGAGWPTPGWARQAPSRPARQPNSPAKFWTGSLTRQTAERRRSSSSWPANPSRAKPLARASQCVREFDDRRASLSLFTILHQDTSITRYVSVPPPIRHSTVATYGTTCTSMIGTPFASSIRHSMSANTGTGSRTNSFDVGGHGLVALTSLTKDSVHIQGKALALVQCQLLMRSKGTGRGSELGSTGSIPTSRRVPTSISGETMPWHGWYRRRARNVVMFSPVFLGSSFTWSWTIISFDLRSFGRRN